MCAVMPFVWSPDVLRHQPEAEVWVGRRTPSTELPARATAVQTALLAAGHCELPARAHEDDVLLAVHEPGLVDWLRTAATSWSAGPYEALVGQTQAVPYLYPTPMMTAGMPWRYPAATHARAGVWCYDTMTPVGPGTWEAARAAVDAALTAVDLVVAGERAAFALTRPPGHHATPAGFGGLCYLNHAAVAARALAAYGGRVAVLDIDAHHGNGTQAVFWHDPQVFYGSVHVDPGAGWFPHVVGFADETGPDDAPDSTCNVPLAPGADDEQWLDGVLAVAEAAVRFGAGSLVVSLGVDAVAHAAGDPLGVTAAGLAATGRLLATMGMPTVLVLEGGTDVERIGELVVAVLAAF